MSTISLTDTAMKKEYIIDTIDQLYPLAEELLQIFPNQRKFAFYGEIGAGKTTFIKQICEQLGVQDYVSSPTYGLISEYEAKDHLIRHLDLYRLNTIEEALDINVEEYLYDEEYCFIEWPQLIEPLFPSEIVYIRIQITQDQRRAFVFEKNK